MEKRHKQQRRRGAFHPHNTLLSTETPQFTCEPQASRTPLYAHGHVSPKAEEIESKWFENQRERLQRLQFTASVEDTQSLPSRSSPVFEYTGCDSSDISQLGDSNSIFSFSSPASKTFGPAASSTRPVFSSTNASPLQNNFTYDHYQHLTGTLLKPATASPPPHRMRASNDNEQPVNMVVEREPPKAAFSPQKPYQQPIQKFQQPEFGKASPLQSRVFNVPKPHQTRPEHHRSAPTAGSADLQQTTKEPPAVPSRIIPTQPAPYRPTHATSSYPDVVEISRPVNHPTWTTHHAQPPSFSSLGDGYGGFTSINPYQKQEQFVDLTTARDDFNPDAALLDNRFGAADPYTYVDTAKATENIKALLEGAFEDEDDKPRTRSRKKKTEAETAGLTEQLQNSSVTPKDQGQEEDDDEDDGTVEGLNVKLLPHQVDGVEWMKEKEIGTQKKNGVLPKGGILADDMGLGKTIQSIALILTNPRPSSSTRATETKRKIPSSVDKGTLVVAPLALIRQWEAEISNRVAGSHELRVCVHHGPQRTKRFQDLRKYDVVITTYQILVSEHANSSQTDDGLKVGCFGLHWYRVILDEAHTIKNRNAKATQACYTLRAEYRWCLTGTPMQNNLEELQSLIKFLRIKPYNELPVWKDQITRPMNNGRGGVAIKRLQYFLRVFMKRRTKDVLRKEGALNPGGKASVEGGPKSAFKITARKIEKVVADFEPTERGFYDRLEKRTDASLEQMMGGQKLNYASALTLLLRLRQACNHPELVGGSMAKDRDALTIGQAVGAQTPRKPKVVDAGPDDLADLFGGLNVKTMRCDVCQIELGPELASSGSIRCMECDAELIEQKKSKRQDKKHSSHRDGGGPKNKTAKPGARIPRIRQVVTESNDEEGEGEWVVPEARRHRSTLGKAGGSDDENAEGGGEWIGSDDSDSENEASVQILGSHKKKVINLDSSREADSSGEDNQSEEEEHELASSEDEAQLARLTTSTKIQHLLKILHRESAKNKFIVFSQFTSMLDLIEPFLIRDGLVFTRYDGSMRNDHREASLERLRNESKTRILLCSLKCGSLGLNLTAASRVVILEPFWNPFVEEQAIDRVHRLNQTVDVIVYKITIAKTVEERILDLQEKKRALAEAAIEGKAAANLSMKDILNLFKRDAEHAQDSEDVGGLGSKMRVLGIGAQVVADVGSVVGAMAKSKRATPPVMERSKGNVRKEDPIYSRRW